MHNPRRKPIFVKPIIRLGLRSTMAAILVGTALAGTRLDVQMVPMLTLTGEVGSTNQIQYVTTLSQTNNWTALTNLALTASPTYFVDTSATGAVKRFYQTEVLGGAVTNVLPQPTNMVFISPGALAMGSPANESGRFSDEGPQTQVTLTNGFWISKYLVTQEQYLGLMGSNNSRFKGDLKLPVESVRWPEATNYCWKLTEQERAASRLPAKYVYRLPTEAEWEFACRAGTTTRFSYGDDPDYSQLVNYAWFASNSSGTTHPVGAKLPNPWGLYDMHGNVAQWCLDWYGAYPGGSVTDPRGPLTGSNRVARGSGYDNGPMGCRSASRVNAATPDFQHADIGMRVVLSTQP